MPGTYSVSVDVVVRRVSGQAFVDNAEFRNYDGRALWIEDAARTRARSSRNPNGLIR